MNESYFQLDSSLFASYASGAWDQQRLGLELAGIGWIMGDRDQPRLDVLLRHIDEHPEERGAMSVAVEDAISTRRSIRVLGEEDEQTLMVLRQRLDEAPNA